MPCRPRARKMPGDRQTCDATLSPCATTPPLAASVQTAALVSLPTWVVGPAQISTVPVTPGGVAPVLTSRAEIVTPAVFVALAAVVLALLLLGRPLQSLLGLLVVSLGVPVYVVMRRLGATHTIRPLEEESP